MPEGSVIPIGQISCDGEVFLSGSPPFRSKLSVSRFEQYLLNFGGLLRLLIVPKAAIVSPLFLS